MIPANGKNTKVDERFFVESYEVRELYGLIWLWYGDKDKIDDKIMFPDDLKDKKLLLRFFKVFFLFSSSA